LVVRVYVVLTIYAVVTYALRLRTFYPRYPWLLTLPVGYVARTVYVARPTHAARTRSLRYTRCLDVYVYYTYAHLHTFGYVWLLHFTTRAFVRYGTVVGAFITFYVYGYLRTFTLVYAARCTRTPLHFTHICLPHTHLHVVVAFILHLHVCWFVHTTFFGCTHTHFDTHGWFTFTTRWFTFWFTHVLFTVYILLRFVTHTLHTHIYVTHTHGCTTRLVVFATHTHIHTHLFHWFVTFICLYTFEAWFVAHTHLVVAPHILVCHLHTHTRFAVTHVYVRAFTVGCGVAVCTHGLCRTHTHTFARYAVGLHLHALRVAHVRAFAVGCVHATYGYPPHTRGYVTHTFYRVLPHRCGYLLHAFTGCCVWFTRTFGCAYVAVVFIVLAPCATSHS